MSISQICRTKLRALRSRLHAPLSCEFLYAEDHGEYLELGTGWRQYRRHYMVTEHGVMSMAWIDFAHSAELHGFVALDASSPEVWDLVQIPFVEPAPV